MHYEINVSLNGQHYFGTHERSATNGDKAYDLARDLRERFPKSEGFEVTLWYYTGTSKRMDIDSGEEL